MMKPVRPFPAPSGRARRFPELMQATQRFSDTTRSGLERTLVHNLRRHGSAMTSLRAAVRAAALELQLEGLDREATLELLAHLVEDTGRACGADRRSLITGEERWVTVRTCVLDAARAAMSGSPAPDDSFTSPFTYRG